MFNSLLNFVDSVKAGKSTSQSARQIEQVWEQQFMLEVKAVTDEHRAKLEQKQTVHVHSLTGQQPITKEESELVVCPIEATVQAVKSTEETTTTKMEERLAVVEVSEKKAATALIEFADKVNEGEVKHVVVTDQFIETDQGYQHFGMDQRSTLRRKLAGRPFNLVTTAFAITAMRQGGCMAIGKKERLLLKQNKVWFAPPGPPWNEVRLRQDYEDFCPKRAVVSMVAAITQRCFMDWEMMPMTEMVIEEHTKRLYIELLILRHWLRIFIK